jgi:redox-sensitive bicupin YhaK (pirin superfamily)
MAGKPLEQTVVAHGPFVMNTEEEIEEAFRDFRSGKMGRL